MFLERQTVGNAGDLAPVAGPSLPEARKGHAQKHVEFETIISCAFICSFRIDHT